MNDFLNGCWDCELDGECEGHRDMREQQPKLLYAGFSYEGLLYESGSFTQYTDVNMVEAVERLAERTGYECTIPEPTNADFERAEAEGEAYQWVQRDYVDERLIAAEQWINERSTGDGVLDSCGTAMVVVPRFTYGFGRR